MDYARDVPTHLLGGFLKDDKSAAAMIIGVVKKPAFSAFFICQLWMPVADQISTHFDKSGIGNNNEKHQAGSLPSCSSLCERRLLSRSTKGSYAIAT
jgi:hypothetical protein